LPPSPLAAPKRSRDNDIACVPAATLFGHHQKEIDHEFEELNRSFIFYYYIFLSGFYL